MKKEEAIARILDHMERHHIGEYPHVKLDEAIMLAISALRGPTREQVEKLRGKWKIVEYDFFNCSCCGDGYYNGAESTAQAESYLNSGNVHSFCPHCGSPMTDKAVDIMLGRLEAMYDDTGD